MIRLSRMGKKKQPTYRLVVSEKGRDTLGRATEIVGNYNPRSKEAVLHADRITYWISKGAQTSDTVWNILLEKGVVTGKSRAMVPPAKAKVVKAEAPAPAPTPTPAPTPEPTPEAAPNEEAPAA